MDLNSLKDCFNFWRLAWRLPYYGGAVTVFLKMKHQKEEEAPRKVEYVPDELPVLTNDMRKYPDKVKEVPLAAMSALYPGMIEQVQVAPESEE